MSAAFPQKEVGPKQAITSADVVDLYNKLDNWGIKIWIDGGWGVDALLEKQTRPHGDLDIALQQKDVQKAREFLEAQGYKEIKRDNEWNFVMGDDKGHQIDFHAFIFDGKGIVIEGIKYPEGSLTGTGKINDTVVRCISPEHIVKFHTGYKLRESDYEDVVALCKKFGIDFPEEYSHLKNQNNF